MGKEKNSRRVAENEAMAKAAKLEGEKAEALQIARDAVAYADRAWQMKGRSGPPFLGI